MLVDVFFCVILFVACMISGIVGFGSNILALPFLSLILDVKITVPILLLTAVINGMLRLVHEYRNIHFNCYFTMIPLAIVGGVIGVHFVSVLSEKWMKLILAVLMIFIAVKGIYELISGRKVQLKRSYLLCILPFLSGVMQAAFACGGPFSNMYILLNLTQKEQIRATQYAVSVTTGIIAVMQYFRAGIYQGEILHFVYLMIPVLLIAFFFSEKIFNKINGMQFLGIVYIVLIIAGLMTGWQAVYLL